MASPVANETIIINVIKKSLFSDDKYINFILLGLVLIFSIISTNVQRDDAYIYFTYAKNLANGNGFVFNPGEYINATTSSLYTLLLGALYFLFKWIPGLAPPSISMILNGICLVVILFTSKRILIEADLSDASLIFPILFIANQAIRNAIGMETFLTLALIFVGLLFWSRKNYMFAGTFCSLAILARPDSIIIVGVLILDWFLHRKQIKDIKFLLPFFIIITPWIIFSYLYFDSIFPSTLLAKISQTPTGYWGNGLIFIQGLYKVFPIPSTNFDLGILFTALFITAFLVSLFYLLFNARIIQWKRVIRILIIWQILHIAIYGLIINPPAYPWYYVVLSITPILIISLVMDDVLKSGSLMKLFPFITIFALCSMLYFGNRPENERFQTYYLTSDWLNNNVPKGSSLSSYEIGVLGYYYSQGPIIDALGLVTPGVAMQVAQRNFSWYVFAYEPDYFILPYPRSPTVLAGFVRDSWFKNLYKEINRIDAGKWEIAILKRLQ